jgi:hypothetical protein
VGAIASNDPTGEHSLAQRFFGEGHDLVREAAADWPTVNFVVDGKQAAAVHADHVQATNN